MKVGKVQKYSVWRQCYSCAYELVTQTLQVTDILGCKGRLGFRVYIYIYIKPARGAQL